MLRRCQALVPAVVCHPRRMIMTHGANDKDMNKDLGKELTFAKLGLMHEIVNVLTNQLNITTPSPIQQLAIPHLLKGNCALLAA